MHGCYQKWRKIMMAEEILGNLEVSEHSDGKQFLQFSLVFQDFL